MFWIWIKEKIKQLSKELSERENQKVEKAKREDMRIEYSTALEYIDLFLSDATTIEEKIGILDYVIKVIKRDLIGEGLAQLVYGKEVPEWRRAFPLPSQPGKKKKIQIELSSTDILVTPWDIGRLPGAIFDLLHEPFDRHRDNYTATYYPEIDLVIINNGIHHTAVASVGDGGIIDCSVFPLAPSFERFSTDGAYWDDSGDAAQLEVIDFRFALLFTLAQMRHKLETAGADL